MIRNKNKAILSGYIKSDYEVLTDKVGGRSYLATIVTQRTSGTYDETVVVIPERLLLLPFNDTNAYVTVVGEYRSRNVDRHLQLFLAVKELTYEFHDINCFEFGGYVCRTPIYRETVFGRKILEVLIAINRGHGKTSYIPCILWGDSACWGKNALNIGDYVECVGRMQSREYTKLGETKTAYEVSISKIEKGVDPNADEN